MNDNGGLSGAYPTGYPVSGMNCPWGALGLPGGPFNLGVAKTNYIQSTNDRF